MILTFKSIGIDTVYVSVSVSMILTIKSIDIGIGTDDTGL